jgi:hypothetical protein
MANLARSALASFTAAKKSTSDYIAIVSNIANHKDLLVENSHGERTYWRDTTVAYLRYG